MCCAFYLDMPDIIHWFTVFDDETARQLREMDSKVSQPSGLMRMFYLDIKHFTFQGNFVIFLNGMCIIINFCAVFVAPCFHSYASFSVFDVLVIYIPLLKDVVI